MSERYRFVADAMLGDVAKWLRILGVSTLYEPYAEDKELIEVAKRSGAVLLTRDRGLCSRAAEEGVEAFYVGGMSLEEALATLGERYGVRLEIDLSDTRCPLCNGRLRSAGKGEVKGRVPESVLDRYDLFLVCGSCGHVYWPGTHLRRMRSFLRRVRQARKPSEGV